MSLPTLVGIVREVGAESVLLEDPNGLRHRVPILRSVRPEVLALLRRRIDLPVWIGLAPDRTIAAVSDRVPEEYPVREGAERDG